MTNVEEIELLGNYQKWMNRSPLEKIIVMEKRIITIRWLGIVIGLATVPFLGLNDIVPMYLLISYAILLNVFFQFVIIPYRSNWLLKPILLTFSDILLASAAVYLTGGLKSDFYLIYFLLAVLSAVRFGHREAIISTSLSTVLYIFVIYKETDSLSSFNVADIILRMGFVLITGVFVGYLGDRTRQIEMDLQKELDKAHAQLNESTALLNQSLELEDVLTRGVEQASRLIKADLSMILMDESNAQFLAAHDFHDIILKPFISCRRMFNNLSDKNIQVVASLFTQLSETSRAKHNLLHKGITAVDCTANQVISRIFSLEAGSPYYLISIPLLSGKKKLGTLNLVKFNEPFKLREPQVDLVLMYGDSISSAITNSFVYTQSKLQAITDSVTGLYNHRYLQDTIKIELDNCLDNKKQLSLIVLDIDNFKQFNDTYGHSVGDIALKYVANIIQESINGKGLAARYGGDEFVIVLPSLCNKEACDIAESIRVRALSNSYVKNHHAIASLQITQGVATAPLSGKKPEELFEAADSALYIAKYSGKNTVQSAFELSDIKPESFPKYSESKRMIALQKAFSKYNTLDFEMIEAFIAAVDARDHYTYDHSVNVTNYSMRLAQKMNLSNQKVEKIRLGALLHDIGKIGIPDNILNKVSKLSNEEYEMIKQHPFIGAKILQPIKSMGIYGQIVMYHHEWFDGSGYPYGLKGDEIPLEVRIVSICDAYDAMTTDRPYRKAISKEKALQIIGEMTGTQFDPNLWVFFQEMITNDIELERGETNGERPAAVEII